MVLGAIDVHGTEILVQLIRKHCMSSFVILNHSGKKLCAESYETIFVWVSYFILLLFCTQSDEGS